MKKILSFVLCAVMAFSVLSGTAFTESPLDISIVSEAAEYNKTMLPYCYRKLTDEEKLAYLKLRTAFIECRDSLEIEIPTETVEKLSNILMYADVLTNFNYPAGDSAFEYYYYEETSMTSEVMFSLRLLSGSSHVTSTLYHFLLQYTLFHTWYSFSSARSFV